MTTENQYFDQDGQMIERGSLDHPPTTEDTQNRTVEAPQSDFSEAAEASTSAEKKDKRESPDNSGSLFKNDRKTKEVHPDVTGSATISGQEFYVSGWRKTGQKGDFYSLSFRPKDVASAASDLI